MGRRMDWLTETLALPPGLTDGAARLTLTAGKQARIENYRVLLSFSPEILELGCGKQTLRLHGEGLRICCMDAQELLVEGTIRSVEVENA